MKSLGTTSKGGRHFPIPTEVGSTLDANFMDGDGDITEEVVSLEVNLLSSFLSKK
jgi:hypothetical protein